MRRVQKILIANRGEIAIRIMRTAHELGITCVAMYAVDDAEAMHCFKADEAVPLKGSGAKAYLNIDEIVAIAREHGCDGVHPGYGFLSEKAEFASKCEDAGLVFVGPSPEQLSLFGDKAAARALAEKCGIPLIPGTLEAVTLDEARDFMGGLSEGASLMIKAIAGGGGRGMRRVEDASDLSQAYERCQSEAQISFGDDRVYVEQYLPKARHIEVQIIGDGTGAVTHLYERECTLQRRNQKVLEIAPSPSFPAGLRQKLTEAAINMASSVAYRSLGTFEFLVDVSRGAMIDHSPFYFMEANPRIQVEHTVTEEILGLDLVAAQLNLCESTALADMKFAQKDIPLPAGYAIQARINMEAIEKDGSIRPSAGVLSALDQPSGRGVRNEGFGYVGYKTSASYDSLLAKLIIHHDSNEYKDALKRLYQALCEYKIVGVETNIGFLLNLIKDPNISANDVHTAYISENMAALVQQDRSAHPKLYREVVSSGASVQDTKIVDIPPGVEPVMAPLQGAVVSIKVSPGDVVYKKQLLVVVEAMKMEHEILAATSGTVDDVLVKVGDVVSADAPLVFLRDTDSAAAAEEREEEVDLGHIRPDLEDVIERHSRGLDENREEAVAKRRKLGRRTARENVSDLCDEGTFHEYGPLVIAAQRRRRSLDTLIEKSPADGLVAGIGSVNGDMFDQSRVVVLSYDYTVMAGTQGVQNHKKMDRLLDIAERERLPVIIFAEGGGGRPGDTDAIGVSGLDCMSFYNFARLSGKVPLIGIASGRCFAGNAALFGCCDVTIATEDVNLGMGGPAMVEGGGLGRIRPEDIGPADVQRENGVLDVVVQTDAEAVEAAKRYLGFFQGAVDEWECVDQRHLRHLVPENRMRTYNMRNIIEMLSDTQSVQELRSDFGLGMITALTRVEGYPLAVVANNPSHMGGAILSEGADKAARFMQLCNIFSIPILFLCDTPGIMVGPEAEKSGTVRHAARLMLAGANLTVPFFTIVTRKAYGLGALAMAGGSFKLPQFSISWPTGEMGPMGIEGGVALGYRDELEAIEDLDARKARFDELVSEFYATGKAVSVASYFEIDGVIDPAESRRWLSAALKSWGHENTKNTVQPFVDSW